MHHSNSSITLTVLVFTSLLSIMTATLLYVGVPLTLINNEVRTIRLLIFTYLCLRKRLGVENAEKVLDNFEKECREILGKFHLLIHYF